VGSVTRLTHGFELRNSTPCGHRAAHHHASQRDAVPEGEAMKLFIEYVKSFVREDEGQDLLEYALLVALIALVAVVAVTNAGQAVNTIFGEVATQLDTAAGS
jgi:pilus assembly protein Flp/PilA